MKTWVLVSTLALGGCATYSRWDAELGAARECVRETCYQAGGNNLYGKRIYTGHTVWYCCADKERKHCFVPDDKCTIDL